MPDNSNGASLLARTLVSGRQVDRPKMDQAEGRQRDDADDGQEDNEPAATSRSAGYPPYARIRHAA